MNRVLRPGGKLILVDHIRSDVRAVFWFQKFVELFSVRLEGEHMTRRPVEFVEAPSFHIIEQERLGPAGIIERLTAIKRS
jgi:hypothetical protein